MPDYLNAYKQKQRSDFKVLDSDYNLADCTFSAHLLELWVKEKNPDTQYVFKSYVRGAKEERWKAGMAQIEAALGDLFRFLLGPDRAPKMRVVRAGRDDLGVVSKMIPGFISFQQRVKTGWLPTSDELVKAGLGSLVAASWILQEKDLSWYNFGFNAAGQLVKIDNDRALAVITKKICYPEKDSTQIEKNMGIISLNDMNNLINPRLYRPRNWLNREALDSKSIPISQVLLSAECHPKFSFDKWKTMIKASMLSEEMIRAVFSSHVKDITTVEILTKHLYGRFQTITAAMSTSEDCIKIVGQDYATLMQTIDDEIDLYNQEFSAQPARKIPLTYESKRLQYLEHILLEQELSSSVPLTASNLARFNY